MELKSKQAGEFPLRSSLFWYDNVVNKYESTWPLLSANWDSVKRTRCLQKMIDYNCNFITYFLYHFDDPRCKVSPYVGCPSPADIAGGKAVWDWAKIGDWWKYLTLGTLPGVWCVPTLFCGDSREATNNTAFHRAFIPPVVTALHPYVDGFNIASEASKTMSVAQMEAVIQVIRNAWTAAGQAQKYVIVHWQWNGFDRLPNNADALLYEFSWHPKDGRSKSVAETVAEAKRIIAASRLPVLFHEITIESESKEARAQAQVIRNLPGAFMIPGPT
ncbi:MAG: hypothetical protein WC110_11910 [Bacteroidales bacterium]|jgi:hypothetical protein